MLHSDSSHHKCVRASIATKCPCGCAAPEVIFVFAKSSVAGSSNNFFALHLVEKAIGCPALSGVFFKWPERLPTSQ